MKLSPEPVWIIDDDESIRWVLAQALKSEGLSARLFESADDALDSFDKEKPQLIVTDIRMQGVDGLEFLDYIQKQDAELPVIIMTAYSDLDITVATYQRGAREHLPKPFDIDRAVALIKQVLNESGALRDLQHSRVASSSLMIGKSAPMQEIFRAIGRLSRSDINVLITGESGSGKELVAQALYENSIRRNQPFIAINAAAIPADLLESELFGHEKGSFTGANQRRIGRFEQANHGTLFLDEIGDMPRDLQSRLLRVMSEGKFYRVGGVNEVSVDVRIVAATNQDLENLVEQKVFRADLFHRLNVVRIALPPVRVRRDDIPLLIQHFMSQASNQLNVEEKSLTDEAIARLVAYDWPGNVREIENFCRSITVMTPAKAVQAKDLTEILKSHHANEGVELSSEMKLRLAIERYMETFDFHGDLNLRQCIENIMIEAVMNYTDGSRGKAAKLLDWGRNTITRKIKELNS